jgi:multidrug efflux system membrane fusion protein
MKKLLLLLVAVVIVAGVAYRIVTDRQAASAKVVRRAPPVPVIIAKATTRDMPVMLDVVGRAEAYESVTLKSRLDGQVEAVTYTEGQHVKQGDVLVRLDPRDLQARLAQATATLARDQAQLDKAHADVERYVALKARGFVSAEKVADLRTVAAASAATIRADQSAVELARLQLSYTVIRAPFTGIVGARLVFPGTGVKTNDTALALVNRVRPLYVTFPVTERYLPRLKSAMAAKTLKLVVVVPSDKSRRYVGQPRFIDNAVDAASGTIQMKGVLPNDQETLTPGQFVHVELTLATIPDAVVVPMQAVQQGPDGNFLFVVKPDGSAVPRKIEVGDTYQGLSAVTKGLQSGETVVIDGQLRITPGAKVKGVAAKVAAGAAQPATTAPAEAAGS